MNRRPTRYLVDLLLLVSLVVVGGTGFVVDRLELHDFGLHRWAGYALALLAAVHLAMHWRFLVPLPRAGPAPPAAVGTPSADAAPAGSAAPGSGDDKPRPAAPSRRSALVGAGAAVGVAAGGAALGWWGRAATSPSPYDGGDVGLFYHRESSLGVRSVLRNLLDWGRRPEPYKALPDAAQTQLPAVSEPPIMRLADALGSRRSRREFADRPLTIDELAWIVSAATGITSADGGRAAPSAGALYPIETYVAAHRVDGVEPGLYHVDVRAQALQRIVSRSVAGDLRLAGLGQDFLAAAPVVLILSGIFQRTRWKYHERHYRYVCWEGGHIAQNVYLSAEAAGLGACMVGSFLDTSVNELLHVDGREEAALGLIAVGGR